MIENRKQMNHRRAVRVALVGSVAAALSLPLLTQSLHGQTGKTTPTAAAPAPAGAAAAPAPAVGVPATTAPAGKIDPNTVVASVGDIQVTAADFNASLALQPPQLQAQVLGSPEGKKAWADRVVKTKAIAKEAERRKVDQDPELQRQLAFVRQEMIVQHFLTKLAKDESADKKYFEQHPEEFGQVQARHILISTQGSNDPKNPKPVLTDEQAKKKAEEIRARLVKGEDFAKLAKAESDDPGSKDTGGEYTFGRGKMVPAFEQAAYSLKVNEISQPVKTQFGYHIIQLQKHLPGTFEASKDEVPGMRVNSMIKDLAGGDVKFNDAFINAGPVNPAANDTNAPPAPPAPGSTPAKK